MSTTVELHRKDAELQAVRAELVALRAGVRDLAASLDKEADAICLPDIYDKADKAWRVAHVRRRVAEDLRNLLPWQACGRGPCAANDGHEGTCAEASGWDDEEWKPEQVNLLAALDQAVKRARATTTTDAES